jgi:hypothetical protein
MIRPRALLLTLAAPLVLATPAQADSVVDTHDDVVAADGKCSLREAVGGGAADCGTGTIRLLKKRRLTLTYTVSGPGKLAVRVLMKKGKRVGRRTVHPAAAGNVKVSVKLARKAVKAFKARGKLRLRTRAVFTPTGGTPITKSKRVTLRKR